VVGRELEKRIYPTFPKERSTLWGDLDSCVVEFGLSKRGPIVIDWQDEVPELMDALTKRWEEVVRLESLQKEVAMLKDRCAVLERLAPILVPIETLAPEPYEVVKPLHVVVSCQEEQYIACFFDANLGASGDTQAEAIFNLKDIITATFEMLTNMNEDELGPGPLQQKKVLKEFIRAKV
jgi:hypothetical protein